MGIFKRIPNRTQPDPTELNRTLRTDIELEFGDRRIIRYSRRRHQILIFLFLANIK